MNWRIKGVVQKTLSVVPGGVALNSLLSLAIGEHRDFEGNVAKKVGDWSILMGHFRELQRAAGGLTLLEVGTGWFPTVPLCFSLAGAVRILSFDLNRHLNRSIVPRLLRALISHVEEIAATTQRPPREVEIELRTWQELPGVEALLERARIDYRAPADATATGLPDNSVDVVFSNSVLEHVPEPGIEAMMRESFRVLRPGGFAVHSVNCGDHYAYFDCSITAINYLSYSERAWRKWNNDLLYQNRLRAGDFLEMAEKAGLEVILKKHRAKPELLQALERMGIAPEFRRYPPEQLCCTSIDFAARKP